MPFLRKIIIGSLLLTLAVTRLYALQDEKATWYESFFQERKLGSIESALSRANKKLQEAEKNGNGKEKAWALKELGLIHLTRTYDYGEAMALLVKALVIEDSLQLSKDQVVTYFVMARVFEAVSDFSKSEEFLSKALSRNKLLDDASMDARILNELGKIHANTGKIDAAFDDYNHVLEHKDVIDDAAVEADALFNLGHLFTLQGKYSNALQHYKRALAIRRAGGDKRNEALSLNDIGELYRLMKNDEKAMANHTVALEIRKTLRDKKGVAESYNNIGELNRQQKKWQQAIDNLQLALEAGQEAQDQHEILRSYEYLSECYEALGDYKKALNYKDLFFAINELIQGDLNEQQILKIQNGHEVSQKQSQISSLETERTIRELELTREKKYNTLLTAGVIIFMLLAAVVVYISLKLNRSNKDLAAASAKEKIQNLELQELNATKDKFFSIISHDLKGPLNSLTSFSSLLINHTDSLSKEEIKMFAQDFDKSLKNLFALLENLLEWSRSQTGNIEFRPESFDLASVLGENAALLKAQAQHKGITITQEGPPQLPIRAHKNSVNTVVRNLISNAIKFTPDNGTIRLGLARDGKDATVSVTDNGVGMPPEVVDKLFRIDSKHSTKGTANEKGTGLGLILCKEFIEKNGGRIWVTSKESEGSVFSFSLPLVAMPDQP